VKIIDILYAYINFGKKLFLFSMKKKKKSKKSHKKNEEKGELESLGVSLMFLRGTLIML
jgi:uncharacterized protein YutD